MIRSFKAAAIQLNGTPDLDANLAAAEIHVTEAAAAGATLIGLPENFSFIGPEDERVRRAGEIAIRSESFVLEQARRHRITLLGGGFAVPASSGKTWNRALLAGPDGALATYDKIHLFDVDLPDQTMRESATVDPGTSTAVYESKDCGVLGLSICYDLRFPELYRELVKQGAEILMVPSAFTAYTGAAHWEILLRARAIENTCFVVAPAQCGHHFGTRTSYGHAMIVSPWGTVLAEAGEEPGMAIAEIDADALTEARSRVPSLRHRTL